MNIYDLLGDLYHAHSYATAGDDREWPYLPVRGLADAYEALAPDWDNAPDDAVAYAIDADGLAHWFVRHDDLYANELGYWSGKRALSPLPIRTTIPIGIDWRLCK